MPPVVSMFGSQVLLMPLVIVSTARKLRADDGAPSETRLHFKRLKKLLWEEALSEPEIY